MAAAGLMAFLLKSIVAWRTGHEIGWVVSRYR